MNAVKEYRDFEIEIRRGQGYQAYVVSSPAGEGWSPFMPPIPRDSVAELRASVLRSIHRSGRDLRFKGTEQLDSQIDLARRVGTELFTALFSGRVKELFDQSLEPSGPPDRGLRIKLRFDLRDEDSWLGELPWELLRHPDQGTPLALSPRTPLVRYLQGRACWPSLPFEPPLRVLAAAANPSGTPGLDLEAEFEALEKAAGDRSRVEVTFLRHASIDALCQSIQRGRYHVLHFMGHGRSSAQGTALLFECAGGSSEAASGLALAGILKEDAWLRLVVLNACHGGEQPDVTDPFSGVATALVQEGLPAAVAMQSGISDQGAITFSESFYASLAREDPIDAAMTRARAAISPNWETSLAWSVPVLFLRVPDGHLFSIEPRPKPSAHADKPRGDSRKSTGPETYIETIVVEQGDFIIGNKRA